eukprot:13671817-Heterocapsa_arctica.AAC.1
MIENCHENGIWIQTIVGLLLFTVLPITKSASLHVAWPFALSSGGPLPAARNCLDYVRCTCRNSIDSHLHKYGPAREQLWLGDAGHSG